MISFLIGPGCSIFALLALIVFFFYPITSKVCEILFVTFGRGDYLSTQLNV